MQNTPEQIKQRFEALPKDIKEAISSVDTTSTIVDIGEKYKLHIDQIGELVDETGLIMLGFSKSNQFVSNIEKRLGISRNEANDLVREINDKILIKIRESMRESVDKKEGEDIQKENLEVKTEDREKILREIEYPEEIKEVTPSSETTTEKEPLQEVVVEKTEEKEILPEIKTEKVEIKEEKEKAEDVVEEAIEEFLPEKTDKEKIEEEKPQEITEPKHTEIIEKKLTEVVKMPMEEKKILNNNIKQIDKDVVSKKPEIDPYREPIE